MKLQYKVNKKLSGTSPVVISNALLKFYAWIYDYILVISFRLFFLICGFCKWVDQVKFNVD